MSRCDVCGGNRVRDVGGVCPYVAYMPYAAYLAHTATRPHHVKRAFAHIAHRDISPLPHSFRHLKRKKGAHYEEHTEIVRRRKPSRSARTEESSVAGGSRRAATA